jgi:hypothetical protein
MSLVAQPTLAHLKIDRDVLDSLRKDKQPVVRRFGLAAGLRTNVAAATLIDR